MVIFNLWAFPDPVPVNVTGSASVRVRKPTLVNNWNCLSFITLGNTLVGKIVVTTPALFVVDAIETAVAANPMIVDPGVYSNSSPVL